MLPVERDSVRYQIDRQRPGAHHRGLFGALVIAAQRCLAACRQLGDAERLDDVVVGADF
jgi:hypothetical protein